MLCIYHSNDLDGRCSAAILLREFPKIELYGMNYGEKFPYDKLHADTKLYMVDFSLPIDEMIAIYQKVMRFVWIDHHKTAIEAADEAGSKFNPFGLRRVGVGACGLTWEYLYKSNLVPMGIYYLSKYDVFDFDKGSDIEAFQFGMRSYDTEPRAEIWEKVFGENTSAKEQNRIITEGKGIIRYRDQEYKEYLEMFAKEVRLPAPQPDNEVQYDLRCLAVNRGKGNTFMFGETNFDSRTGDRFDIHIAFVMIPSGLWQVSLYSTTVDVSEIAKKYDGGGHSGAAGFLCKELPFEYQFILEPEEVDND